MSVKKALSEAREQLLPHVNNMIDGIGWLQQELERNNVSAETREDAHAIAAALTGLHSQIDLLAGPSQLERINLEADTSESQIRLRHDLRTPLNVVKGYSEILLEDLDPQSDARSCQSLSALLIHMHELLKTISTSIVLED